MNYESIAALLAAKPELEKVGCWSESTRGYPLGHSPALDKRVADADAAILAVANDRGTCESCKWLEPDPDHGPWCGCDVGWPPETDWTDFGCSLFARKDAP